MTSEPYSRAKFEYGFVRTDAQGETGYAIYGSSSRVTEVSRSLPSEHWVCIKVDGPTSRQDDWEALAKCPDEPNWARIKLSFQIFAVTSNSANITSNIVSRQSDALEGTFDVLEKAVLPPDTSVYRRRGRPWMFSRDNQEVPAKLVSAISNFSDRKIDNQTPGIMRARERLNEIAAENRKCGTAPLNATLYQGPLPIMAFDTNLAAANFSQAASMIKLNGRKVEYEDYDPKAIFSVFPCPVLVIPCREGNCVVRRQDGRIDSQDVLIVFVKDREQGEVAKRLIEEILRNLF